MPLDSQSLNSDLNSVSIAAHSTTSAGGTQLTRHPTALFGGGQVRVGKVQGGHEVNNTRQESDWKRQLIEHDIRLQNAKLQMMELQHENKMSEMRELLFDLQDKNQQIELEKQQLVRTKEKQILDLSSQVKQLEQQLISANLEIANVRSQLHIEE